MTEFDLNPARAQLCVLIFASHTVSLQDHAMLAAVSDATLGRGCPVPALMADGIGLQRGYHQPAGRASIG